jgi:hypothetical protein
MSQTRTASATYTVVDIENVVRRVKADLVMIADSTGGWTAEKTRDYTNMLISRSSATASR